MKSLLLLAAMLTGTTTLGQQFISNNVYNRTGRTRIIKEEIEVDGSGNKRGAYSSSPTFG